MRQAGRSGIDHFVVPATTRKSWEHIDRLASKFTGLSVAYGIHPYFVAEHTRQDVEALDRWLDRTPAVAVGEIGLDYYLPDLDRARQLELFRAQLDLAVRHRLPVILHARKAVEEVSQMLRQHGVSSGIVHSFNGSYQQAQQLVEMGFKLGFGGAITYPRATRLRALVQRLPLEAICLETDAPDQPSARYQGQRNEPLALIEVLETITGLRKESVEIIAAQTTENTYAALNIC